jgi:2-polyprenyl-3-methyl-5-hydroxy-6-metoxy-1,4-benzoquinol methylase
MRTTVNGYNCHAVKLKTSLSFKGSIMIGFLMKQPINVQVICLAEVVVHNESVQSVLKCCTKICHGCVFFLTK